MIIIYKALNDVKENICSSTNWFVVFKIYILKDCKSCNLPNNTSKQSY